jgi:acyl carrier protein
MKLRWWKNAQERAQEFENSRSPLCDDDFIAACSIPDSDHARHVALAVRRSVATYGICRPEFIRPDDRYPQQLGMLSGWDSIDFLGWTFELDKELELAVPNAAWKSLKGPGFSVEELIQAILAQGELRSMKRR